MSRDFFEVADRVTDGFHFFVFSENKNLFYGKEYILQVHAERKIKWKRNSVFQTSR